MNSNRIVMSIVAVLVTASTMSTAYGNTKGSNKEIIIIGDSIGHGVRTVGNHLGNTRIGATVDNLISIVTTVPSTKDKATDRYVFVSVGTNDYYRGYNVEQYNHKLVKLEAKITAQLKPKKITYLIPCNTREDIVRGTRSVIEALKMGRDFRMLPCSMKEADTIHYTTYGYKHISDTMLSTDTVSYTNSSYGWTNNKFQH